MYEDQLSEIDKENLFRVIETMPDQLTDGLALSKDVSISGNFDFIVLSGMGGSALSGELLQIYLNETINKQRKGNPFKIIINRSYTLPPEAYSPKCLNIISSYSGNTEETLYSFKEVIENKLACLSIASSGRISEISKEQMIPSITLPQGIQPRMALGLSFSALLGILFKIGILPDPTQSLNSAKLEIIKKINDFNKIGKETVSKIHGQTPIIYSSSHNRALAMIWKIMFNENSKTPAFWNYFPELNHNEMVGFTKPQANFSILLLKDSRDHPRILQRYDRTESLLINYGVKTASITIPEGDVIFRIFSILQIGCFASYYLALAYEIDPTPVEMVERFKSLLQ